MKMRVWMRSAAGCLTLALAACGGGDVQPDANVRPATEVADVVNIAGEQPAAAALVLEVAPTGNEARYRVREQLVGVDFPNDAVGTTSSVSGRIVFDDAGNVVPDQSQIVVDVTNLESDRSRRDGYVRDRLLQAEQHPAVTLRPTAVRGLPSPVPASGEHTFQVIGDLTVLDVTRPTTWDVTAQINDGQITGTATTRFTFDDFSMAKPRVRSVLSVADSIGLEYDFNLVAATRDD